MTCPQIDFRMSKNPVPQSRIVKYLLASAAFLRVKQDDLYVADTKGSSGSALEQKEARQCFKRQAFVSEPQERADRC